MLSHLLRRPGIWDIYQYCVLFYEAVLVEALLQQFHAEIGTFHLSYRDNIVLLLDWCGHKRLRWAVYEVSFKDPWEVCLSLGWTMVEGVNGFAT